MLHHVPHAALSVSYPFWLYAQLCLLPDAAGLLVYRSVAVRPDDVVYEPVAALLAASGGEILHTDTYDDDNLMFATGEVILYKLGETTNVVPGSPIHPVFESKTLADLGVRFSGEIAA